MTFPDGAWGRAIDLLDKADSVALGCHVDPDGDGIGSILALRRVLAEQGKQVDAGWAGDVDGLHVPPPYSFLPDLDTLTGAHGFKPAPDVFVALDCASIGRLGALGAVAEQAGAVLVVDHHAAGTPFGDVRLVDEEAAATVEIVAGMLDRLGVELDLDLATFLYVGLVTDTGRFGYASTSPATMRLGGRLIDTGIDHTWINRQLYETHSFGYLKVLAGALQRATLVPASNLVWTSVTQADLRLAGVSLAETEGLIDVLRAIDSAACALVCKEQQDGTWRASLRSKGEVDVGSIAQALGGGGHAFAAGFVAAGPLDEVVVSVRALIDAQAERG